MCIVRDETIKFNYMNVFELLQNLLTIISSIEKLVTEWETLTEAKKKQVIGDIAYVLIYRTKEIIDNSQKLKNDESKKNK